MITIGSRTATIERPCVGPRLTSPHVELFRAWMEERELAASTIDRRLSTVCGFFRLVHIDGRIASNPARFVRQPEVHPSDARGLDCSEGVFLFPAEQYDRQHAALAVLFGLNGLQVSEACATKVEDLGLERGHRRLRTIGKATSREPSRSCLETPEPSTSPSLSATRGRDSAGVTASAWTREPPTAESVRSAIEAGLVAVHPHMLRAAFVMAALDADVPLRDVQNAGRHADPRTTTINDRRRQNFDRNAAYVVVAFVAGGDRSKGLFVLQYWGVEIHPSAGRHGIADDDMLHAVQHSMVVDDVGEDPDRWLVIGPDRAANLLEVIVLITAEDDQVIIHAMPLRAVYRKLLDP